MSDHARQLAAGIQSFLDSLPFMAPEAVGMHARVKLATPLAEYKARADADLSEPTPPSIVARADDPTAALGAFIAQELENWNFHVYAERTDAMRVSTGLGVVLTVTIEKAGS